MARRKTLTNRNRASLSPLRFRPQRSRHRPPLPRRQLPKQRPQRARCRSRSRGKARRQQRHFVSSLSYILGIARVASTPVGRNAWDAGGGVFSALPRVAVTRRRRGSNASTDHRAELVRQQSAMLAQRCFHRGTQVLDRIDAREFRAFDERVEERCHFRSAL